MITFKKKCSRCNKNYVQANNRTRFVVCYDCQKKELEGEIKDPEMKKLFDIPEKLYMESNFLRDIKSKYLRFGELSERQIEAFAKVSKEMQEEKSEEDKKEEK